MGTPSTSSCLHSDGAAGAQGHVTTTASPAATPFGQTLLQPREGKQPPPLTLCSLRVPGWVLDYLPGLSHPALAFALPGHHPALGVSLAIDVMCHSLQMSWRRWSGRPSPSLRPVVEAENYPPPPHLVLSVPAALSQWFSNTLVSALLHALEKNSGPQSVLAYMVMFIDIYYIRS